MYNLGLVLNHVWGKWIIICQIYDETQTWLCNVFQAGVLVDFSDGQGGGLCDPVCPGAEDHDGQSHREAGLRASHAQRRIQELSVNIRLKEELIRELDKTGTEASCSFYSWYTHTHIQ